MINAILALVISIVGGFFCGVGYILSTVKNMLVESQVYRAVALISFVVFSFVVFWVRMNYG